jgi:hypothetical protein
MKQSGPNLGTVSGSDLSDGDDEYFNQNSPILMSKFEGLSPKSCQNINV